MMRFKIRSQPRRGFQLGLALAVSLGWSATAAGSDWGPLVNRLAEEGWSASSLESLFESVRFDPAPVQRKLTSRFESKFKAGLIRQVQEKLADLGYDAGPVDGIEGPKTRAAVRKFQKDHHLRVTGRVTGGLLEAILDVINPNRVKPPKDRLRVYRSLLEPERLQEAQDFLAEHGRALDSVNGTYAVPPEITVAILAVESRVGNFLGTRGAFQTLASLASASSFSDVEPLFSEYTLNRERRQWLHLEARRLSSWAYQELVALLQYAEQSELDLLELPGSVYGAIGISQFMPTSALRFGVDGNDDGRVNLFEVADALASLGNYMRENGWRSGLSRRNQARVLLRYNRDRTYVNTVLAVAGELRKRSAD